MSARFALLRALMHKEIRGLIRDPQGLLVLFLMPTIFILVMSLALRDVICLLYTSPSPRDS